MAEDVKLEMTGAGAILQSNFLFPGWIKLDNSYTSLPSLFSVKWQCVQLIMTWQKKNQSIFDGQKLSKNEFTTNYDASCNSQ